MGIFMNNRQKFFVCKDCENVVGLIRDSENLEGCKCIEGMTELVPQDGGEAHCIAVSRSGNQISVTFDLPANPAPNGSSEWVYLMTKEGGQRKSLPDGSSVVSFMLTESDTPLSVYAYCGSRGFWRKEL